MAGLAVGALSALVPMVSESEALQWHLFKLYLLDAFHSLPRSIIPNWLLPVFEAP